MMNNEAVITRLANLTGASREQVIEVLTQMGTIPQVRKELDRISNDKEGRKVSV